MSKIKKYLFYLTTDNPMFSVSSELNFQDAKQPSHLLRIPFDAVRLLVRAVLVVISERFDLSANAHTAPE